MAGTWGFALDDSWIHATIARNFATGHGFAFNPGDRVAGSTGPLFTLLLSAFYFLFRDVVWTAKLIGVACHIGATIAIVRAARVMEPKAPGVALVAGLLMAISPPLLWAALSGMEISLYLFLVCLGLHAHARGRTLEATLLWALGVWARPDGLFLLALSLAVLPGLRIRRALAAAPIVLAFVGFNWLVGESALPQTVGVKTQFGFAPVERTWSLMREWGALWGVPYRSTDDLEHPVLLLVFLLAGAAITARKRPLLALYVVGLPIALSLFRDHSGSHKRYILCVVPFGILLAAQGMAHLSGRLLKRRARSGIAGAAAALLLWQASYGWIAAETYGWNVQNINKMQRLLAGFARDATRPGDRIATNDIGAIGYFSDRYVVDLMGLVTPLEPLPVMLSRYKPELILVFPDWFKDYVRIDPEQRSFVFYDADSTHKYMLLGAVELRKNTICAKDQMLAMKRLDVGAPPPRVELLERL